MLYMESRTIQYARNQAHIEGASIQGTWRQWKRVLHNRMKKRMYEYIKEITASKQRARQGPEDTGIGREPPLRFLEENALRISGAGPIRPPTAERRPIAKRSAAYKARKRAQYRQKNKRAKQVARQGGSAGTESSTEASKAAPPKPPAQQAAPQAGSAGAESSALGSSSKAAPPKPPAATEAQAAQSAAPSSSSASHIPKSGGTGAPGGPPPQGGEPRGLWPKDEPSDVEDLPDFGGTSSEDQMLQAEPALGDAALHKLAEAAEPTADTPASIVKLLTISALEAAGLPATIKAEDVLGGADAISTATVEPQPSQQPAAEQASLPAQTTRELDPEEVDTFNASSMIHWKDAMTLSKANKYMWHGVKERAEGDNVWHVTQPHEMPVSAVQRMLIAHGSLPYNFPWDRLTVARSEELVATPGRWFTIDLPNFAHSALLESAHASADWQTAYHGTSIFNIKQILEGGPREGFSQTSGRRGIYCEGTKRRHCCMNYITHTSSAIPKADPYVMWGALFELVVDRSRGGTIHKQWVQKQGSVFIRKVHIHCFHLRQAYEAGWLGVFSVSTPMMKAMAEKRPRELPDPRQYLADRASQAAASAASSSRSAGHDD